MINRSRRAFRRYSAAPRVSSEWAIQTVAGAAEPLLNPMHFHYHQRIRRGRSGIECMTNTAKTNSRIVTDAPENSVAAGQAAESAT